MRIGAKEPPTEGLEVGVGLLHAEHHDGRFARAPYIVAVVADGLGIQLGRRGFGTIDLHGNLPCQKISKG